MPRSQEFLIGCLGSIDFLFCQIFVFMRCVCGGLGFAGRGFTKQGGKSLEKTTTTTRRISLGKAEASIVLFSECIIRTIAIGKDSLVLSLIIL
jgi:hypothetical protein